MGDNDSHTPFDSYNVVSPTIGTRYATLPSQEATGLKETCMA